MTKAMTSFEAKPLVTAVRRRVYLSGDQPDPGVQPPAKCLTASATGHFVFASHHKFTAARLNLQSHFEAAATASRLHGPRSRSRDAEPRLQSDIFQTYPRLSTTTHTALGISPATNTR